MINTLVEYSTNRNSNVASRADIQEKLALISNEGHHSNEICNGHDFCYVLHMISKNGIGSKNRLLQDPQCVEDLLISQFDWLKFSRTELFFKIGKWQLKTQEAIFNPN